MNVFKVEVYRTTTISDQAYRKEKKKYCSNNYGSYNTLSGAQSACTSDENCAAIFDNACDNVGFKLCPTDYSKKNSWSSCLYVKNQSKENISSTLPTVTSAAFTTTTTVRSTNVAKDLGMFKNSASYDVQ